MPYAIQLPNGKTVFVKTLDQALNFDFQDALASDSGYEINDPFFGSPLKNRDDLKEDEIIESKILSFETPDISDIEEIDLDEYFEDLED